MGVILQRAVLILLLLCLPCWGLLINAQNILLAMNQEQEVARWETHRYTQTHLHTHTHRHTHTDTHTHTHRHRHTHWYVTDRLFCSLLVRIAQLYVMLYLPAVPVSNTVSNQRTEIEPEWGQRTEIKPERGHRTV